MGNRVFLSLNIKKKQPLKQNCNDLLLLLLGYVLESVLHKLLVPLLPLLELLLLGLGHLGGEVNLSQLLHINQHHQFINLSIPFLKKRGYPPSKSKLDIEYI